MKKACHLIPQSALLNFIMSGFVAYVDVISQESTLVQNFCSLFLLFRRKT